MVDEDRELEVLRAAQEQLSHRIYRNTWVRLVLLLIIIFTLANALKRICDDHPIMQRRGLLAKVETKRAALLREPEVLYRADDCDEFARPTPTAYPTPSPSPFPTPSSTPLPGVARATPAPSPSPSPAPAPPQPPASAALKLIREESDEFDQLLTELEAQVEPPKVQTYIKLDREMRRKPSVSLLIQRRLVEGEPEVKRFIETRAKLAEKITDLRRRLKNLEDEVWSLQFSFLGTGPKIDLRNWIYALPFLFLLTELYVQLLRKKLQLLSVVGACAIRSGAKATKLDALIYSEIPAATTPYSLNPATLEKWLYLFSLLLLAIYSWGVGASTPGQLWHDWTEPVWGDYVHMLVAATYFAVAFYCYQCSRMEAQAFDLTGCWPPPNIFVRVWERCRALAESLAGRFVHVARALATWRSLRVLSAAVRRVSLPKLTLGTGSLLILMTLLLATGSSCGRRKPSPYGGLAPDGLRKGYELMPWREDVWWYSATFIRPHGSRQFFKSGSLETSLGEDRKTSFEDELRQTLSGSHRTYWDATAQFLGKSAYLLSQVLAALSLLLILLSFYRPRYLRSRRTTSRLLAVAGVILSYIIIDFSFSSYWFSDRLFPFRILAWLGAAATWFYALHPSAEKARAARTRKVLVILFIPLVVNSCGLLTNAVIQGLVGLPVYFAGILLLTLGYWLLMREALAFSSADLSGVKKLSHKRMKPHAACHNILP